MDFSSIFFIWVFLPLTLAACWIAWFFFRKDRSNQIIVSNILLLLLSLFFYSWAGIKATFLLICVAAVNYFCGRYIASAEESKKKTRLVLSILFNVLVLACFKYGNMIIVTAEGILSLRSQPAGTAFHNILTMQRTNALPIESIILPLAISFVIFQSISYIVDVYKGKTEAEKNIFYFALYELAFFQLVQGPIVRYPDFAPQLRDRELTADKTAEGIRRFCFGLGKKVIIANSLAAVVDPVWSQTGSIGTADAWAALIMYTFQIYFDFSGYSDMAVGLGKMLGFEICENFNHPYVSKSVQEFWRRWHMSLSSWFRDYIYIPLGGNRRGQARTLFNIFVVFLVTGIWHGANWTFICWGLWYALLSIVERIFLKKVLDKNPVKVINWAYAFFVVVIGWALFRSPDIITAGRFISTLFSGKASEASFIWASFTNVSTVIAFIAALVFMGPIPERYGDRYDAFRRTRAGFAADSIFAIAVLIISVILVINGSYSPSIYAAF